MMKLIAVFKSSMLRWWFMITAIYSVSSACPCCGKQGCPGGVGAAVVVGAILVFIKYILAGVFSRISLLKMSRMLFRAPMNFGQKKSNIK